jgi:hypothetical protein
LPSIAPKRQGKIIGGKIIYRHHFAGHDFACLRVIVVRKEMPRTFFPGTVGLEFRLQPAGQTS